MSRRNVVGLVLMVCGFGATPAMGQQIGKFVPVQAGSEVDHALTEINATTDPTQKLALIDKFAAGPGKEDLYPILADGLYVDYYIAQKNYEKVFDYGNKLFALDPDNFQNAMNLVRAAAEKGDPERLVDYGEKAGAILQRFRVAPAPEGTASDIWEHTRAETLEGNKEGIAYIQQLVLNGAFQVKEPARRGGLLVRFAHAFPDSAYATQAIGVAATAFQQAQNTPKMLEIANGLLAKDPNNLGMLLLLSDYYCDKPDQLDKAESFAKKVITLLEAAQKPQGVADEQWAQQKSLQKGVALSSWGQVQIERKDNALALENLKAAGPLLKPDDGSYAKNQYRLGFALLNLKKSAEAKEAFTQAASVNSPYKQIALDKLKTLSAQAKRKAPSE